MAKFEDGTPKAAIEPCDMPLARAVDTWLDSLLAAARPELMWTPHGLSAALQWCALFEGCTPCVANKRGTT